MKKTLTRNRSTKLTPSPGDEGPFSVHSENDSQAREYKGHLEPRARPNCLNPYSKSEGAEGYYEWEPGELAYTPAPGDSRYAQGIGPTSQLTEPEERRGRAKR